ncbi:MAG: PUA domain-containing protein [Haloferacaceae archaeon]
MRVTSRHHLRSDEIRDLEDRLGEALGIDLDGETYEFVELEGSAFDLVLVDGEPAVCHVEGEPFLTVRGANRYPPERRVVTVDEGAVSFVSDGADVMRPGIVAADDAIAADDLVVVTEEAHGKALAVGRALVAGDGMIGESGRVVESIHHVGDDLYAFDV